MERLGEVDEADDLVAGIGRPAAAIDEGIARQHRAPPAVAPRQAGDDRATPLLADLEERAAIDAGFDDRPDAIDLAAVARDGVEQGGVAAAGIVVGRRPLAEAIDRGRQVGEEPSRTRK